eukprot:4624_1
MIYPNEPRIYELSLLNVVIAAFPLALLLSTWACIQLVKRYQKFWQTVKREYAVPGPPVEFPLGNVRALAGCEQFDVYKKILSMGDWKRGVGAMWVGDLQFVIITQHDDIMKVLMTHHHHDTPEGRFFSDRDTSPFVHFNGERSLPYLDANMPDAWSRARRILGRAFLTTAIKSYEPVILDLTKRSMSLIEDQMGDGSSCEFKFEEYASALMFDIVGKCAMGQDFGSVERVAKKLPADPIIIAQRFLTDECNRRDLPTVTLFPWLKPKNLWIPVPSNRGFVHHRNVLRGGIKRMIDNRREALKTTDRSTFRDVLGYTLGAKDPETGTELDQDEMIDHLIPILFGGQHSMYNSLCYLFYCVARHPEVQSRLQKEIDECLQGATPTQQNIKKISYIHLVYKEALRLYAPVCQTIRALKYDMDLGGYNVKKGTIIIIPMYLAQRDPHNWDDPLRFDPDRHLEEHPNDIYLPFAGGMRNCIGQRFAYLTGELILALMIQRYEFSVPTDYELKVRPVNITTHREEPLRLVIKRREGRKFSLFFCFFLSESYIFIVHNCF